MVKNKQTKNNLKKLEIPYIGIKVESIPTILKVLNEAQADAEFIKYFEKAGKKEKTATEYLASLRNLKLAEKDKNKQTKINNKGLSLLQDDVNLIYENLLNHCLKSFPDLKTIKDIIKNTTPKSLNELIISLQQIGYTINRPQTLSSYYKFFKEIKLETKNIKKPHISEKETLEYHQFVKYVLVLTKKVHSNIIEIKDLKTFLKKENVYNESIIEEYLKMLDIDGKIRLYQIDNKLPSKDSYLEIDNKIYYYFEVIDNAF